MIERRLSDRPRDAEYVTWWLERAGMTLLSLPDRGPTLGLKVRSVEVLLGGGAGGGSRLRRSANAADISAMDEVLGWLRLIPEAKRVVRRIVAARLLVSPETGRHLNSWRRIGRLIGADHHAVQRWHAEGIGLIVQTLGRSETVPLQEGRGLQFRTCPPPGAGAPDEPGFAGSCPASVADA
jgi:hypothetical protein